MGELDLASSSNRLFFFLSPSEGNEHPFTLDFLTLTLERLP